MNGKAMKWEAGHRDIYVFDSSIRKWVKVICELRNRGMRCTSPSTLPRGTKFDYNVTLTAAQEYYAEMVLKNQLRP